MELPIPEPACTMCATTNKPSGYVDVEYHHDNPTDVSYMGYLVSMAGHTLEEPLCDKHRATAQKRLAELQGHLSSLENGEDVEDQEPVFEDKTGYLFTAPHLVH